MFRAFHNELLSNLQFFKNRMCMYMVLDRTIHSAYLAFVLMHNQCASPYLERDYGTPLIETLPLVEPDKHLKNATS